MRYPWANTLLLVFISAQLLSGFFGLVSGSPDWAIYLQLHRIVGFAIVALLGWKALIVVRSLRRRRERPVVRGVWLLLTALLLAVLSLGLAWGNLGRYVFLGFSGVSWHIYLALGPIPLLVWHAIRQTRGPPLRFWLGRRLFLRATGLAVVGLVLWQATEQAVTLARLSGAGRRFTGSYPAKSYSGNAFPRVSWINDHPPGIDVTTWRLEVGGAVQHPLSLDYTQVSQSHEDLEATLDCTGGWYTTQRWQGIPLSTLLDRADVLEDARSVTVTSVTGYYRRFSLHAARNLLLATHVGGKPLSHGHGAPLRLVAPGRRGFEWVKWVVRLKIDARPFWLQPPLPLQ